MIVRRDIIRDTYDNIRLIHIACNDYILAMSKIGFQSQVLKIVLKILFDYIHLERKNNYKNFLMPISTDFICSYPYRDYRVKCYFTLNGMVVLLYQDARTWSSRDEEKILEELIKFGPISRLFDHMRDFIKDRKISEYKAGYQVLLVDINNTFKEIIEHIQNECPDVQLNEDRLNQIYQTMLEEISQSIQRKIAISEYNCINLLKSPIIVRISNVEIKLDRPMGTKWPHDYDINDKKIKNFIINVSILSFIKALPNPLWDLLNEDALSVLVKTKIDYAVVHENKFMDYFLRLDVTKRHNIVRIPIGSNYLLVLVPTYTLSNRVNPLIISINGFSLSFLLRSNSVKNFWFALNEFVNKAFETLKNQFKHHFIIYRHLAI